MKIDTYSFQDVLHLLKMLATRLVEKLADARQFVDDGLVGRNFAVKHAQRIRNGAALAIRAHLSDHWLQRLAQSFVISGAIVGTADGVQLQGPVFDSQSIEQSRQQFQNLGVTRRRLASRARWTDDLRSDLIELTVSSFLRTLAAKLRPDVIKLVQAALPKLVLDVSANDPCGVLRAQR